MTNYVIESLEIPNVTHKDNPTINLLGEVMKKSMLVRDIRDFSGAFDAGYAMNYNNFLSFYSFRDPHNLKTFEHFESAV